MHSEFQSEFSQNVVRDVLHEVEGVLHVVHFLTVQLSQMTNRTLNFEAGNEM